MNILEIGKYKGFYKFLSILKNNKEASLNMLLDGYTSTDINEEGNYLELYYEDGKAKITCEPFEVKGLIKKTEYKYNIKVRKNNFISEYIYESNRNKVSYDICTKNEQGVYKYNGEISTKKGEVDTIFGTSKAYNYKTLYHIKPSVDFEAEPIQVVSNYVGNFSNRFIPTYKDTFDLAVFCDRPYLKYNEEQHNDLVQDYDKTTGINVAFHTYINGDLRPANALVEENNQEKSRTLR